MLSLSSSFFLSPSLALVQWPWKRLTSKMAAVFEGPKNSFFFYQLCRTCRLVGYVEDREVKLDNNKSLLMMKTFDSSVCKSIQKSDAIFACRRSTACGEIGFVQNVNRGNVGGKGYLHLFMKGINFNISCIALC